MFVSKKGQVEARHEPHLSPGFTAIQLGFVLKMLEKQGAVGPSCIACIEEYLKSNMAISRTKSVELAVALLCVVIIATAVVSTLASRGTVILLCLSFISLAFITRFTGLIESLSEHRMRLIPFVLFIGWLIAASFWSDQPAEALVAALKVSFLIVMGIAISILAQSDVVLEKQTKFGWSLIAAMTVALVIIGVESLAHYPLINLLKGSALDYYHRVTLAHGLPIIGAVLLSALYWLMVNKDLTYRIVWFIALGALTVLIIIASNGAGKIAVVAGLCAFALCYKYPRVLLGILAAYFVYLFAFPFVASALLPTTDTLPEWFRELDLSWAHRVLIYKHSADLILTQPVFGWGFDMSRELGARLEPLQWSYVSGSKVEPIRTITASAIPLHPHSLAAQFWLELGFVGVSLWASIILIVGSMIWRMRTFCRLRYAAFAGLFTNIAVVSNLSFGAWQSWWVATIFLTIMVLVLVGQVTENEQKGTMASDGSEYK